MPLRERATCDECSPSRVEVTSPGHQNPDDRKIQPRRQVFEALASLLFRARRPNLDQAARASDPGSFDPPQFRIETHALEVAPVRRSPQRVALGRRSDSSAGQLRVWVDRCSDVRNHSGGRASEGPRRVCRQAS